MRRRLFIAALILAIVGLAAAVYFRAARRPPRPENVPEVKSIAVLPFKTLGGADGDEHLGQAMADALITKLSNLRQIVVRPTSAVLRYDGAGGELTSVAREQRVDALLDGRIQREGRRVRCTVQLVRGADGVSLWAATFDEEWTDIFAVQDSISEQVVRALTLELTGGERALIGKRYTENAEAFELYSRGRFFWNKRTSDSLRRAIEHFEQATRKDPKYALAYVGLADSYTLLGSADYAGIRPREAVLKATEAAVRAIELDDTLAEAHTTLAFLNYAFDWDWPAAEAHFRRAIELNPNYPTARHWYALFLTVTGRADAGLEQIERALALDPLSHIINTDLALIYYYRREYDRAIAQFKKTLEAEPNFSAARWRLGRAYAQVEKYEAAEEELRRAMEVGGRDPVFLSSLGQVYAASGRRAEALKVLDELKEMSRHRYVFPHQLATVYIGLGRREEALDWLYKAYEERSNAMISLKVEPLYDSLRTNARYRELLRRVDLADTP